MNPITIKILVEEDVIDGEGDTIDFKVLHQRAFSATPSTRTRFSTDKDLILHLIKEYF
jgi:hypothetical protein